jgi:putative oxidoreductase
MAIATSLFILRVVIGLVLVAHGSQKLLGWFGGPGFGGTIGMLKSMGFKPAAFWALLGALGEFAGGLLLAFGFLTPLGAIAIFASMLMAVVKFHWKSGFWSMKGGYEYALVLGIVALVLGISGPGSYSVDALLAINFPAWLVVVGFVAAIIVDAIGVITSNQQARESASQEAHAA